MDGSQMNRRDFQRLTAAALGRRHRWQPDAPSCRCGRRNTEVAAGRTARLSRLEHLQRQRRLRRHKGKNDAPAKAACATAEKHDCKGTIPAKAKAAAANTRAKIPAKAREPARCRCPTRPGTRPGPISKRP